MRLILVRHGETESNVKKIMQGQSHGKLSKNGKKQVKELALKLKAHKVDMIFSSDLERAAHTTKAIAKFHKVPVYHVSVLREMHVGIFEGKSWELFNNHLEKSGLKARFRPKNGESYYDVRKRMHEFVKKLYKDYKDKTILISTHGIAIKCVLSACLKIPLNEAYELPTKNAGYIILDVNEKGAEKVFDALTV